MFQHVSTLDSVVFPWAPGNRPGARLPDSCVKTQVGVFEGLPVTGCLTQANAPTQRPAGPTSGTVTVRPGAAREVDR